MNRRTWAAVIALLGLACAVAVVSCTQNQVTEATRQFACSDLTQLAVGQTPEIRLLVLYSTKAKANSSDLNADISIAVEELNQALHKSGVSTSVVVAHTEEITLTNEATVGEVNLVKHMTDGTNEFDRLASIRTKFHADVVALVAEDVIGASNIMLRPSPKARDSAFMVVGRVPMNLTLTFAHEFGHLLAGVHQQNTGGATPGYKYAYPEICLTCVVAGQTGWRTIMATNTQSATTRIQYFSNPDIEYGGTPLGSPNGSAAPRDMRKTLTNTSPIVSNFYATPAWFTSSGASSPWFEKYVGDELMTDILFADFDNDRESDALRVDRATGDWFIARSGKGPWEFLRTDPDKIPIAELRTADFDGDGAADVFRSDVAKQTWYVSTSATSDWRILQGPSAALAVPVADLSFGDFNSNGKADVFRADVTNQKWLIAFDGTSSFSLLGSVGAQKTQATVELGIADFDGDKIADVLWADENATTWKWSKSGTSAWQVLNGPNPELTFPMKDLAVGDFDGDGKADVVVMTGFVWSAFWGGTGSAELLKTSCVGRRDVKLGDFDGDGVTDIVRAGIRP